jgi:hypothetical protein
MDTGDSFLRRWFAGINAFLDGETPDGVGLFLFRCAEACSESFPAGLYRIAFSGQRSLEESLAFLEDSFSVFRYRIYDDRIEISYSECGCDLYTEGLITSPRLCECSEKSLLYCWESVFGKGEVQVRKKGTIIGGDDRCLFEVRVRKYNHPFLEEGPD